MQGCWDNREGLKQVEKTKNILVIIMPFAYYYNTGCLENLVIILPC